MLVAETAGATPWLIALVGSGGFLGALLSFVKLRGDKDSQAVSQAQGAMETMQELNESLARDRDYWRGRFDDMRARCLEQEARIYNMQETIDKLTAYDGREK